ncbi:Tn3 family transposase [Aestuariicella sp. G3-2]|uniref:Tn3 family transposase n=1 Tax=Pseudomaricurvus albidus TaxID=2842452 RepID=UPI001C0BF013|nr:Tn3 family transposase [Aestuariicella albida]MBU3071380.1 Tn3 family transposase [Aestuariicella albida]
MPVEFLTKDQKKSYGKYNGSPSKTQLAHYFFLDDNDLEIIQQRRKKANQLGYALQLCTLRFLGTNVNNLNVIPLRAVHYVASQLQIKDISARHHYTKAAKQEHLRQIKEIYGYTEFSDPSSNFRLLRWLYARAWVGDERPSILFDMATRQLVAAKTILPGVTTLSRLISTVRQRAFSRMVNKINNLLSDKDRNNLDSLTVPGPTEHTSVLDYLRSPVDNVNSTSILAVLQRLSMVRELAVNSIDLSSLPSNRVLNLAKRTMKAHAINIRRMTAAQRPAFLVAFAQYMEVKLIDDSLDLFEAFIADIQRQARLQAQKHRLRTLKDLDEAALLLAQACDVLLDGGVEAHDLRGKAFSLVSSKKIGAAIETVRSLARPRGDQYQTEWIAQYNRIKRFLPRLMQAIDFHSTNDGTPVLNAIKQLVEHGFEGNDSTKSSFKPVLSLISKNWKKHIVKEGEVDKSAYCVYLTKLFRDNLQRREIYVKPSERWGNPRLRLLRGHEWQQLKPSICRALNLSEDPAPKVQELVDTVNQSYLDFLANLPENPSVRFETKNSKPHIILTPLEKQDERESLELLRERVKALMPYVDLPEILLEIHCQTGFADEFFHISEESSRVSDLPISICAVLLAEACNIGIEPLIKPGHPALSRRRLTWVKKNYLRAETIAKANAVLVEYHADLPLVRLWGGGEIASADGLRFIAPSHTAYTRYNKKYFHSKPGVTYYNFLTDQYAGFHGLLIPGTERDSIYLLAGLLEQQTALDPKEVMTDTAGTSDIVFGLFWLLGYQFSPRIADIGSMRFWRFDKEVDYGVMNAHSKNYMKQERISNHWEDMLRIAGSLRTGKIGAVELIKTLLSSKRPSALAKAIAEVGKANKTIHGLRYLRDKKYRRIILSQLNRGESRHTLARTIFYGRRGELRRPYKEGQEDQLGALGLVLNIVVLWNTLYIEAVLQYLKANGHKINREDVAQLSPLGQEHLHVLGRYSFDIDPNVEAGGLRPIRVTEDDEFP